MKFTYRLEPPIKGDVLEAVNPQLTYNSGLQLVISGVWANWIVDLYNNSTTNQTNGVRA